MCELRSNLIILSAEDNANFAIVTQYCNRQKNGNGKSCKMLLSFAKDLNSLSYFRNILIIAENHYVVIMPYT